MSWAQSFICYVIFHGEFIVKLLFVSGGWKRKITEYFTRRKEEGNACCHVVMFIHTEHYSQVET
jgi:hypothetical protein